ncbi:MmcQ/YjbR family DNA-binding protein [Kribbella deserti]|uniref:MmcQ/YjbR family DNA-binding protein n=1 Tax=Kribbella deserti TaxID=1926257 RepID=A0ABV6QIS1_9ACTN
MVTIEDVRAVTADLPRSYEVLVRDRVKFRVGRIVYLAFSRDEQTMGLGFPKEQRAAALAAEPHKFLPPSKADERYQWIECRLDVLEFEEMRELVLDAWTMCVPKSVSKAYFEG